MVREEEIENEPETDDDVFTGSGSVSGSVTDKSSKTTAKSILSDVESEGAESVSTLNGPVVEKVSSLNSEQPVDRDSDDEADDQAFKEHLELVNIGKRLKELQREIMELTDRQVILSFTMFFLIKLNQGIFARKKGVEEALKRWIDRERVSVQ